MSIRINKPKRGVIVQYGLFVAGAAIISQVIFSGFVPIKNLAILTTSNIAGIIGVAGTVNPNEYNTLAAQFEQKNKELAEREQAVSLRENDISTVNDRITLNVLLGITGLLVLLLLLNFYLDWKRGEPAGGHVQSHRDEMTTRL